MTAESSRVLAEPGYQQLLEILRSMDAIAIACSGGLDSSLLLTVAHRVIGERVLALTVMTPYMASREIAEAQDLTTRLGIRHQLLTLPISDDIAHNPPDRCYRCKRTLFAELKAVAAAEGLTWLADGANQDDLSDYRPGMRALRELAVRSPLLEAGLGKVDLRRYARALNLPVWNKPASACLLTRLPHDTEVQPELLHRIEVAEQALLNLGFGTVRVRCHGDLARIEIDRAEQVRLLQADQAAQIVAALTECGFRYVTLDLSGYRMGSYNTVAE